MINRTACRELQAAGMDAPRAEVVAAHLPDWSQFATRRDLAELRGDMDLRFAELRGEMAGLESHLIRWLTGIFLALAGLLAAAVSVLVAVLG